MHELEKLWSYLTAHGYKCKKQAILGEDHWNQIVVYKNGKRWWDAVCHYGSYGHEQGLLEIMAGRDLTDSEDYVEGHLKAVDIIERLERLESTKCFERKVNV